MSKGGTLSIEQRDLGPEIQITISDSGVGRSKRQTPSARNPLFYIKTGRKRDGAGPEF